MNQLKVLVIEDDDVTRNELAELLTKEEYEVVVAADGNKGREFFETESPDIVITDLRMPGPNGLELIQIIHQERPFLPVILVTAYGETEIAIQAVRLGAFDYIKKPIDLEDLFLALGRAKEVIAKNQAFEEFPSILIAEDDTVSRKSLADVLIKEDLQVIQAVDGIEALEAFVNNKVDIILLDIKMPRLDGLETLKRMRQLNDDFEAIILTGYGDEMTAIEALRQGAMSFVRKPIDLDEVLTLIDKAREKLSMHRSLKYRMREVNLAYQIIAQITTHEEILIHFSDSTIKHTKAHASSILNHIQDGVILVGRDLKIQFANRSVRSIFENQMTVITQEMAVRLFEAFGHHMGYGLLTEAIEDAFEGAVGKLISLEQHSTKIGIAAKVHVRINRDSKDYVLVVINKHS